MIKAAAWRSRQAQRALVTGAWLTAVYTRQERLKPLDRILRQLFSRTEEVPVLTPEQELAAWEAFAKAHNERNAKFREQQNLAGTGTAVES